MFSGKVFERTELVSGTVIRFGSFLVTGASSLTYELMLDGHAYSFRIGAVNGLRPTSRIHLTAVGDSVAFEAASAKDDEAYRIGVEASFKNLSLSQ